MTSLVVQAGGVHLFGKNVAPLVCVGIAWLVIVSESKLVKYEQTHRCSEFEIQMIAFHSFFLLYAESYLLKEEGCVVRGSRDGISSSGRGSRALATHCNFSVYVLITCSTNLCLYGGKCSRVSKNWPAQMHHYPTSAVLLQHNCHAKYLTYNAEF